MPGGEYGCSAAMRSAKCTFQRQKSIDLAGGVDLRLVRRLRLAEHGRALRIGRYLVGEQLGGAQEDREPLVQRRRRPRLLRAERGGDRLLHVARRRPGATLAEHLACARAASAPRPCRCPFALACRRSPAGSRPATCAIVSSARLSACFSGDPGRVAEDRLVERLRDLRDGIRHGGKISVIVPENTMARTDVRMTPLPTCRTATRLTLRASKATTSTACAGESVAVALFASGERVLSRSIKYHRPRGFFCLAGHCGACLMRIDGKPNVKRLPDAGARRHARRAAERVSRRARSTCSAPPTSSSRRGMDHHTMMTSPRALNAVMQKVVRQLGGLGRLPDARDGRAVELPRRAAAHVDVVVVGGGPAGSARRPRCARARQEDAARRRAGSRRRLATWRIRRTALRAADAALGGGARGRRRGAVAVDGARPGIPRTRRRRARAPGLLAVHTPEGLLQGHRRALRLRDRRLRSERALRRQRSPGRAAGARGRAPAGALRRRARPSGRSSSATGPTRARSPRRWPTPAPRSRASTGTTKPSSPRTGTRWVAASRCETTRRKTRSSATWSRSPRCRRRPPSCRASTASPVALRRRSGRLRLPRRRRRPHRACRSVFACGDVTGFGGIDDAARRRALRPRGRRQLRRQRRRRAHERQGDRLPLRGRDARRRRAHASRSATRRSRRSSATPASAPARARARSAWSHARACACTRRRRRRDGGAAVHRAAAGRAGAARHLRARTTTE